MHKMPEITHYNTTVSYLLAWLRSTAVYNALGRLIRYSRRFLFITRIFKYISIAAAIIETSAVLILAAAITVVLIPIALLVTAVFSAVSLIISVKIIKSPVLSEYLKRERIYVIADSGNYGKAMARELTDGGYAVFLITPSPKEHFVCARWEKGVLLVRHSFFFNLKRKKLNKLQDKLIYLL